MIPVLYTEEEEETDAHKDIANTRQNKNLKDSLKKYRLGTVSNILLEGLNQFNGANLTLNSDVDQDTDVKHVTPTLSLNFRLTSLLMN